MSDIVQKLWGFCHTLRHDGVDYGDYIEQLTYLLFLKMANEQEREFGKVSAIMRVCWKRTSRTSSRARGGISRHARSSRPSST